jgi:TP901 family phage tail tape measure protein
MADLQTNIAIRILDAFTGPLRKFQDELGSTEERAKKIKSSMAYAADLNQAAEAMGRFSASILGPMKGAVDEFRGFEKSMSAVSALSGEMRGTANFEALKKQALDLGAATAFSAEEAADAMAVYAQAGRTTEQILAMTPVTLDAAKANNMGLAETAAIVGHTMTQMGMQASEATRAVDVLSFAAASSDMTLQDMGTALAYVGPVAHQAGMSLETTAAFLGKLKDAGLEASSAGVGMRAVLTRLLDPSREATRALGQLGFNTRQVRDLQKQVASGHPEEALARIGKAAEKLPNERRMKLMSQIFGMEAQTAATVAIQASMDVSADGLRARADKILRESAGTNERMAKIMTDNLDGALERAGGAISGLKTQVGEVLAPSLKEGAEMVEGFAGKLQGFVTQYPRFSKASLELVGGLGLTAAGMQGLLTTVSAYESANAMLLKSYDKLTGSLTGRMGLVGAAAAAGYAIGSWADDVFQISKRLNDLFAPLGVDTTDKQGVGPANEAKGYAGGWEYNKETGEVTKVGTGRPPADIARALATAPDAKTPEEISAIIRMQRGYDEQFKPKPEAPESIRLRPAVQGKGIDPLARSGGKTLLGMGVRDAEALSSPVRFPGARELSSEFLQREQGRELIREQREAAAAQLKAAKAMEEAARRFGVGFSGFSGG